MFKSFVEWLRSHFGPNVSEDAVVTVFISLFVFSLGLLSTLLTKYINKIINRRKKRRMYMRLFDVLKEDYKLMMIELYRSRNNYTWKSNIQSLRPYFLTSVNIFSEDTINSLILFFSKSNQNRIAIRIVKSYTFIVGLDKFLKEEAILKSNEKFDYFFNQLTEHVSDVNEYFSYLHSKEGRERKNKNRDFSKFWNEMFLHQKEFWENNNNNLKSDSFNHGFIKPLIEKLNDNNYDYVFTMKVHNSDLYFERCNNLLESQRNSILNSIKYLHREFKILESNIGAINKQNYFNWKWMNPFSK